jgi:type IV pilus assembly protein PilN
MIRINLLGVDRHQKGRKPAFGAGQQLTVALSLILVATTLGIGWWYWSLQQAAAGVEEEIAAAQQEQIQLKSVLTEVREFEAQRAQLQQRVQLIEQLRAGQSVPVQLLDHVSRSVPDMLWLTDMEQTPEALTLQGRSTTLIAVSDFVGNLGGSELLVKPIELVNSQVETVPAASGQPAVDVIRFTIRAVIKPAAAAAPPAAVAGGRGAAAR